MKFSETIPEIKPRQKYNDEYGDAGWKESLQDWAGRNKQAVEWFFSHRDKIKSLLKEREEIFENENN